MKTAVYNVRMDIRSIATLHKHYTQAGIEIPSVSSLTRRAIEYLADSIVQQLGAEPFESTTEATQYLEHYGLMKPLRTRGQQAIVRGMQKEVLSFEGYTSYGASKRTKIIVPQKDIDKAVALLEETLNKKKEKDQGAILGKNPGEIKE